MQKNYFLLLFLGLFLIPAYGQNLYVTINADGSKSFSDTPSVNSVPYSLLANNISGFTSVVNSTSVTASIDNVVSASNSAVSTYASVAITQPSDQTTFQNQTPIHVQVSTQPTLKAGDQLKLMLDGVALGSPQTSLTFTLTDLTRGTHQVQVAIVDKDGNTLKNSMPITIFKQQATVLLPVLPPSPTK